MDIKRVTASVGGKEITLETGRIAKQAGGAVFVTCGESAVLVTVTAAKEPKPGLDFFPLTVEYIEKQFAAGKFPGGFFKREGRPHEREILTARMTDRPIRPLFPEHFRNETQVIATVFSAAPEEGWTDVMAMVGASAALMISDVPWSGPVAGVRVGRVGGKLIANPNTAEIAQSDIDIIVSASKDAVLMVEGGANEVPENEMLDAIFFGHESVQGILRAQVELQQKAGKPKRVLEPPVVDEALVAKVKTLATGRLKEGYQTKDKHQRQDRLHELKKDVYATFEKELGEVAYLKKKGEVAHAFEELGSSIMRSMVLDERRRIDGRGLDEIRPISTEVGLLARTHGSALFQRGETQALATITLGTKDDEQKIDGLLGESYKRFMLHYNFPPYSVGEAKPLRSPGRREIGHGNLAERALAKVIPEQVAFPYTIRLVSEITESNGSSSMASVCGGCLALMDAGVPVKSPVAGIAMGLLKEGAKYAVLSDILGDEDHLGDMDFKVCGTKKGVTAFQLDLKIEGITRQIMAEAMEQARRGRLHIMERMLEHLPEPRKELSKWSPRIVTFKIPPNKIRDLIGPGGKTIRSLVEQFQVKIDVEDDGSVNVASADGIKMKQAVKMIKDITSEAEPGKLYYGQVKRVVEFGAFVEILPGTDGLLHVSELAKERVKKVEDVVKEGDFVIVKCLEVSGDGRIRLSRKEALGKTLEDVDAQEPKD